jgi:hypothetical protein
VFWGEKRRTTNSAATTFSYTRMQKGGHRGGCWILMSPYTKGVPVVHYTPGVLATLPYILVYEKVVAAELVVRHFSPPNTPPAPAVKAAGPPGLRS